jgi:hypothetical protein
MNAQRIEGAVALVTGANRGIGSSPKASDRQIAAMTAAMLSRSAA